jgi:hypothetical protein
MVKTSMNRLSRTWVALVLASGPLAAQSIDFDARLLPPPPSLTVARWTFGPVKPHIIDAGKRTVYAAAGGAALMGVGILLGRVNDCGGSGTSICAARRDVQAGMTWAFLGAVAMGSGPQLKSKCNRSARAVLSLFGAAIGVGVASEMLGIPLLRAGTLEPVTFKTMGTGLAGLSIGSGVFSAIC